MNIKPLADRVLILPAPAEEKTIGGIIIPDTAKEKPLKGEVVATGNGIWIGPKRCWRQWAFLLRNSPPKRMNIPTGILMAPCTLNFMPICSRRILKRTVPGTVTSGRYLTGQR